MAQLVLKNLSFTYPQRDKKSLDNISLCVDRGEFVILCGRSGCGKTTLLRQIKATCAPAGKREGSILFEGKETAELSVRKSAENIGFVMQNTESQIVTDKVWHELAFGLENLGKSKKEVSRSIAEISLYFGLDSIFDSRIDILSGGQKKLVALASVMVLSPTLILFDEPVNGLDPVAAHSFMATISRINREFGITVIISGHHLEEALTYADRIIAMDEGRIKADCRPDEIGRIALADEKIRNLMPAPVRIFSEIDPCENLPLNVSEGRRRLEKLLEGKEIIFRTPDIHKKTENTENAVKLKSVFFRYNRNDRDVLRNLSLEIPEGSFFAVLGGNGAGKSTLLKLISAQLKPYSGKIKTKGGKISLLPQDVQTLFTKRTVRDELEAMGRDFEKYASLCDIEKLLDSHPYDISGGEQQRAALALLLMSEPDIILLDEPTSGLDREFKKKLAEILRALTAEGKTIIAVSHDTEFCAENADQCALLFDGEITGSGTPEEFFGSNLFFTTDAASMTRGIFTGAVTDAEVIALCRKNTKA